MAVAVVVDAVLDVGGRQKLGLADLAGIGADQVAQRQVAALENLQRCDQLALEQLGAAAVVRHGRDHADHRQLTDVAGPEIALQPPDRDDDRRRHAELSLDAREQRRMPRQHLFALVDAAGGDAGRRVLLEGAVERGALAAVERQHRGILRDAGKRACNDALRHAGGRRLARHRPKKAAEIAAALRRARGRAEEQRAQEGREGACDHWCNPIVSSGCKKGRFPASVQVTRIITASKWRWAFASSTAQTPPSASAPHRVFFEPQIDHGRLPCGNGLRFPFVVSCYRGQSRWTRRPSAPSR